MSRRCIAEIEALVDASTRASHVMDTAERPCLIFERLDLSLATDQGQEHAPAGRRCDDAPGQIAYSRVVVALVSLGDPAGRIDTHPGRRARTRQGAGYRGSAERSRRR
jgi:hypothetical protein